MLKNRRYIPTGRPVGRPRKTVSETTSSRLRQDLSSALVRYISRKKGLSSGLTEDLAYLSASPELAKLLASKVGLLFQKVVKSSSKTSLGKRLLNSALGLFFADFFSGEGASPIEDILETRPRRSLDVEEDNAELDALIKTYLTRQLKKRNAPAMLENLISPLFYSGVLKPRFLWALSILIKQKKFLVQFEKDLIALIKAFVKKYKGQIRAKVKSTLQGNPRRRRVRRNPQSLPEIYTKLTCLEISEGPRKAAIRVELKGRAKVYGCEDGSLLLVGNGVKDWKWNGWRLHAIEAVKGNDSGWAGEAFRHDFTTKPIIKSLENGTLCVKGTKVLHKNFDYPGMIKKGA